MTSPTETICAYESRNEKIEILHGYFKFLLEKHPELSNPYLNFREFISEFYWEHIPKTLEMEPCYQVGDNAYVGIMLTNYIQEKSSFGTYLKKVHGYIHFYGHGSWEYNFNVQEDVGELTYAFSGLGYDINLKEGEAPDYAFYLNEELDKLLSVPEPYSQEFLPRYKINNSSHSHDNNKVAWAWREGYYDGPISGYCYLNKKLYYYNVQEEKPYSLERMYGLYSLSRIEKVRAYTMHYLWKKLGDSKKMQPIYHTLAKYLKNKNFRDRPVVGYFNYE